MAKFVKHTIDVSAPITPEQREMLMKLKDSEPVPDDDSPEYTAEEIIRLREIAAEKRAGRQKQTVTLRISPQALNKAKSLGNGYTSVLSRILEAALSDTETLKRYL